MPDTIKIPVTVTIILMAVALIAAAISFIYFPTTLRLSSDLRCYDINGQQLPLSDDAFQSMEYTDVSYDLTVTKHWFMVTDIDGRVQIGGEWYDIARWQRVDGAYYCSLLQPYYSDTQTEKPGAFVLDGKLGSVRVTYNDGRYEDNAGGLWYGPAGNVDELLDVLADLGIDYRSYQV